MQVQVTWMPEYACFRHADNMWHISFSTHTNWYTANYFILPSMNRAVDTERGEVKYFHENVYDYTIKYDIK